MSFNPFLIQAFKKRKKERNNNLQCFNKYMKGYNNFLGRSRKSIASEFVQANDNIFKQTQIKIT